jgi:acetolactate synthase-1/2/3 large subunit
VVDVHTGADLIVRHAINERVPYAVGLCGHGVLGLLDALYDHRERISTISVHHEAVAGFIADAYYRLTRQPLMTFTSCGPGTANLPVALGSALMDDSAFLAVTGNVPTTQFGRAPFQELGRHFQADATTSLRPFVKRAFQATRPEQLPRMLAHAFAAMRSGRPGPVHLDVPLDVFAETTSAALLDPVEWTVARPAAARDEDLDLILGLIGSSERPLIVAGSGVDGVDGTRALLDLARATGIPVATSPLGKAAIPSGDPLALGTLGRNGTLPANRAARNSDLILAFGTRFDDRSTSSWLPGYTYDFATTRLVHVHVDPMEISRNFPAMVGVAADPAIVLAQLRARWGDRPVPARPNWSERLTAWLGEWDGLTAAQTESDQAPLRPERLLADLRRVLPRDGILLSDVGIHHNWIVQRWRSHAPQTVLQSWGYASMGFGVAGIVGAHLARPDRTAVAVVGDGGFLMLPSVVSTAVEYDIPAVWIVWENGGYVSIRDQQRGYFGPGRELATSFRKAGTGQPISADFAAMARAMGGDGIRVDRAETFAPAVEAALASRRPTVIHVRVADDAAPLGVATWELPPKGHPQPSTGWPDDPID